MRIGQNPEKSKDDKNTAYYHRVIIPVYIPNVTEDYYKEALDVFDLNLKSLKASINAKTTVVTVVNNNSCAEVDELINTHKDVIDKYVVHKANRGKVYSVLQEAYGCYEPFITITDADVLFLKGWEQEVFKIFKHFPKAGTVAPVPCPNLALNRNSSVFFDHYWKKGIQYKNFLNEAICNFLMDSINNYAMFDRYNRTYDWKQKQYAISRKGTLAIVGCGHYVATYKRDLFKGAIKFPEKKFFPGYEDEFIDALADKNGGYRLSCPKLHAYHVGNRVDKNVEVLMQREGEQINESEFKVIRKNLPNRYTPYKLRHLVYRFIFKFFKL